MASSARERFLLLERVRSGSTSVFEMRLNGKKLHVRHGNKAQKLAKKIYKKSSNSEASAIFSDKRKQKINDGYRIVKEDSKNDQSANAALPKSQQKKNDNNQQPQMRKQVNNKIDVKSNHKTNNNDSKESDEESSQSHRRLRHGKQARQKKHRKHNKQQIHKMKQHKKNTQPNKKKGKAKARGKAKKQNNQKNRDIKTETSVTSNTSTTSAATDSTSCLDHDSQHQANQENNSKIANGYEHQRDEEETAAMEEPQEEGEEEEETPESEEFVSAIHSESEDDEEDEPESDSSSHCKSSSGSVQSGRSSDSEYEMDYEKMSDVMYASFNTQINLNKLQWKPLKLWIRFNEYNDSTGQYALAPQCKRIAGSCHELLVIYIRSNAKDNGYNDKGKIYRRLLKLARDPEEDNKHHFDSERHISQYLCKIAATVNHLDEFVSRTDVCVWPVETILFDYNGCMKYATVQAPFLPAKASNNIFVKIEPNSGKACVNDSVVGRYQHLFSSLTRGLDLIRDWQGYGVSQSIFLNVCRKFNVQKDAISQVKVRKNKTLQSQTQVLIVIDPVLTTYNAHYFTNNPTDFGIKAIDEWVEYHDCHKCRCKYFSLLPIDEMQFGIADPNQLFFDIDNFKNKNVIRKIKKLRYNLNIYQGDDVKIDSGTDDDK